MKKTTLAIGLLAIVAAACTKSKTTTTSPTSPTTTTTTTTTTSSDTMSFIVDGGSAIKIDSAKAVLYNLSVAPFSRMIDVYAFKAGHQVLEFHFTPKTGDQTAGTSLGTGSFLTYMENDTTSYDSQSGTLSLTECDTVNNKIKGTFYFKGKTYPYTSATVRSISEGKLSVTKLTKQ